MKRILVPIDFSKYSEEALKVAAQIARKNKSEIILLHLLELPHQGSDSISTGSSIPEIMFFKNTAISNLEDLMDADYLNGIYVSEVIKFEKVPEGILEVSKINDVDLIVMGSHGKSKLEELIIGSNTEKVVRMSDIPVLVVKRNDGDFRAKNLVFASDFSKEIRKPFEKIVEFSKIFNSNLYLVMICTPSNFKPTEVAEKIMHDFVADFDMENYSTHIYNDANVEKGLFNFANTVEADLIGICTHDRTGLAHFFNGSIEGNIANHSTRPLITFKI